MSPSTDPSRDVTPIRLVVLFWFLCDKNVLRWHRTTVRRPGSGQVLGRIDDRRCALSGDHRAVGGWGWVGEREPGTWCS